jgi:hypothetical protein
MPLKRALCWDRSHESPSRGAPHNDQQVAQQADSAAVSPCSCLRRTHWAAAVLCRKDVALGYPPAWHAPPGADHASGTTRRRQVLRTRRAVRAQRARGSAVLRQRRAGSGLRARDLHVCGRCGQGRSARSCLEWSRPPVPHTNGGQQVRRVRDRRAAVGPRPQWGPGQPCLWPVWVKCAHTSCKSGHGPVLGEILRTLDSNACAGMGCTLYVVRCRASGLVAGYAAFLHPISPRGWWGGKVARWQGGKAVLACRRPVAARIASRRPQQTTTAATSLDPHRTRSPQPARRAL